MTDNTHSAIRFGAVTNAVGSSIDFDTVRVADGWLAPFGETSYDGYSHFRVTSARQLRPMTLGVTSSFVPRFPADPGPGKMYYGLSLQGGASTLNNFENTHGVQLGIHRLFYTSGTTNYSTAANDLSQGRLPWISTKVPGDNWAAVANGSQNAWLAQIAAALAALAPGPVWFCLHHEPRSDGTPENFRAMWEHAIPYMKAQQDLIHVAFGPILNGFSFTGGNEPDPEVWCPNTELDMVAFDQYNQWWTYNTSGTTNTSGNHEGYRAWHDVEHVIGVPALEIKSWGFPVACAEHATHYPWDFGAAQTPQMALDWINDAYDYSLSIGLSALSFYASAVNSPRGSWQFDVHDRPPNYTTKYPDHAGYERLPVYLANLAKPSTAYL